MSTRPTSAVVRAVTDGSALVPLSNRLHAVLAVGMRSSPAVSTGVVYSDEPPDLEQEEFDELFFLEGEWNAVPERDDPRWGSDMEWVKDQIKLNRDFFLLASREFRKSRELAVFALKTHASLLEDLSPAFRNDRELVKFALLNQGTMIGGAYRFVGDGLKRDDEIIRFAFEEAEVGDDVYVNLPDDLKLKREYMILGATEFPANFRLFPTETRQDPQFLIDVIDASPETFTFLPTEKQQDPQFLIDVIKASPEFPSLLAPEFYLIPDENVWIFALSLFPDNIEAIPSGIRRPEFVLLESLKLNGGAFEVYKSWNELNFFEYIDVAKLKNKPEFRMAAATAKRNPNMKMMGAILHDLEAAIKPLVEEKLIVRETDTMRTARMDRLEGYQDVLEKLAKVPVAPGGPMDTKIQELTMLLNSPTKSEALFKYRMKRDLGDMLEETKPGAKRARVATEARALDAGFGMARCAVHTSHTF